MPNYPCIPPLVEIDTKLFKLYHLLQMIILCSILQKHDEFCKGHLSESIQNAQLPQYIEFGRNQCDITQIMPLAVFSGLITAQTAAAAATAAAAK